MQYSTLFLGSKADRKPGSQAARQPGSQAGGYALFKAAKQPGSKLGNHDACAQRLPSLREPPHAS